MKIFSSFLAAILCAVASTFGQAGSPIPGQTSRAAISLTTDEKQELVEASQKAQQDPEVQAALVKLHEAAVAGRAAMVKNDPSIAPLLDMAQAAMAAAQPGASPHPRLTADDFLKIQSARMAIKDTPVGQAWQQATAEYRIALQKAMVEVDPGVEPILEKISQRGLMMKPTTSASPSP